MLLRLGREGPGAGGLSVVALPFEPLVLLTPHPVLSTRRAVNVYWSILSRFGPSQASTSGSWEG